MNTILSEFIEGVRVPSVPALRAADRALVTLGRHLKRKGYRFTTITPASHARVLARPAGGQMSFAAIFGWNLPFTARDTTEPILNLLDDAKALETVGGVYRSLVRFSTLGEQLFVHSAFPTNQLDAVFFGPDTYRFARFIRQSLNAIRPRSSSLKIVDIGAGSGAGGLHAAATVGLYSRPILTLSDINTRALQFGLINAAINGVSDVQAVESDLFGNIGGSFDLIIANPPYLVDPLARLYRHGGGELGFELSLRIVREGLSHLADHGRLLLYTGSAIIDGVDVFHRALLRLLAGRAVRFAYEEIDPDVFGEELEHPPYHAADRIAVIGVTIEHD